MITRTILVVAALYAAIQFCHLAAQSLFSITIPPMAQFGYVMAAAYGGVMSYVNIQRRVPTWKEATVLSAGSILAVWIVSAVFFLVYLNLEEGVHGLQNFLGIFAGLPVWPIVGVLTGVNVLQFITLMFVFRWSARRILVRNHPVDTDDQ
ncbi:hypothetical protein CF392_10215 [Tamilnaduibacter salinus]|uniref:Uncharacterized protein n=1 Tax=Tamilnaduibacter salinus TaxID=1484056 RepID=A0A2A2I2Q2_9GAMM|nr:ABZJ_00895 family protein [Tamilnaduibacter salinus]PAV25596.1 hypothetical protein CF392_10215 [Tamilnaduibacter salinus]